MFISLINLSHQMKKNLTDLPLPLDIFSLVSLCIKSQSSIDLIFLIFIATLNVLVIFIHILILNHIMAMFLYYQSSEGIGLIVFIALCILVATLLITLAKIRLQSFLINKITNISILCITYKLFKIGHSIKSFDILNHVYQYKYGVEEFIKGVISISFNLVAIIVLVVAVCFKNYTAGIITLSYCVAIFLTSMLFVKFLYIIQEQYMKISSKLCSYNFEMINGIRKIIANNIETRILNQSQNLFTKKISVFKNFVMAIQWQSIVFMFLSMSAQGTLYFAMLSTQMNDIMFVIILSFQAIGFSIDSSIHLKAIYMFRSKAKNIKAFTDFLEEVSDNDTDDIIGKISISGQIDLINLSFKPAESNEYLLENINLSIKARTMICIQGKSGVGKTSLVRMISGFEPASSGTISFDYYHLKNSNLISLRHQVSVVLQNHTLFPGTLREILAGNKSIGDDELNLVCLLANFQEDFIRLKLSFDSVFSCDNIKLSKGQQQKLIIAQALAKNPKILILDEALSAVDNKSYLKILNNIKQLSLTSIIITHRETNLDIFDQVYKIENKQLISRRCYGSK